MSAFQDTDCISVLKFYDSLLILFYLYLSSDDFPIIGLIVNCSGKTVRAPDGTLTWYFLRILLSGIVTMQCLISGNSDEIRYLLFEQIIP